VKTMAVKGCCGGKTAKKTVKKVKKTAAKKKK
jgi:hypothetical protein